MKTTQGIKTCRLLTSNVVCRCFGSDCVGPWLSALAAGTAPPPAMLIDPDAEKFAQWKLLLPSLPDSRQRPTHLSAMQRIFVLHFCAKFWLGTCGKSMNFLPLPRLTEGPATPSPASERLASPDTPEEVLAAAARAGRRGSRWAPRTPTEALCFVIAFDLSGMARLVLLSGMARLVLLLGRELRCSPCRRLHRGAAAAAAQGRRRSRCCRGARPGCMTSALACHGVRPPEPLRSSRLGGTTLWLAWLRYAGEIG